MPHTLFYATAGILLLSAALLVWALIRQARAAESRASAAETTAAMAYGKGFRDATDEINKRREHEAKASYDKGFENGWNAALTAFEVNATIISGGGTDVQRAAAA
jgi:hypothetical protein